MLSASESVDPEDRFRANVFLVAATNGFAPWREEAESEVEYLITHGWALTIESQQASLVSPEKTVPSISAACRDEGHHGLRKAASVLLAAKGAVRVPLGKELLLQLKEICA